MHVMVEMMNVDPSD